MFELIAQLQKRPPHERRRIAFWTATMITGVIALVWLLTLLVNGMSTGNRTTSSDNGPSAELWLQMKNGVGALFDRIREAR